jgi:hypothetical protein
MLYDNLSSVSQNVLKFYKIKYSKEVDATVSGKKLEVQKNPNNPSY